MNIDDALWTYLTTVPYPLTSVANRVYKDLAPQGSSTSPSDYIVITRVSIAPKQTHYGPPGSLERTMQFSVWSRSQSSAKTVTDTLRQLIDGFSGTMGTVQVWSIMLSNQHVMYDDTTKQFHYASDYNVAYVE